MQTTTSPRLAKLKQILDESLSGSYPTSKLTDEAMGVGGFISPNTRHLLNKIGSISTHYLECGSHIGSSLVSVVYGNENIKSAIAVDNFSLFSEGQDVGAEFYSNCEKHIPGRYKMLEKDYFSITKEDLVVPPDFYYFDGAHDYESQYKAMTYFAPLLADECIVMVDDFSWFDVNRGTMQGVLDAGMKIQYLMTLNSGVESDCTSRGWWNGYVVMYVKK